MKKIDVPSYRLPRVRVPTRDRLDRVGVLLLILAVSAFSRAAWAEADPPPARANSWPRPLPETAPTERYWYGYQIVISDFFGASFLAAGLASLRECGFVRNCNSSMSTIVVMSGATLYGFGGPAVHAARSHWGRAGASLALRLAPVATGFALQNSVDAGRVAPLLLLTGMGSAMLVDSTVFGYEEVTADSPKLTFAPMIDPKSAGGALVMATTF